MDMATSIESLGPVGTSTEPAAKPLDEAVWQAWLAKSRERERSNSALRITILTGMALIGLIAAAMWFGLR
jgi:hypothetical protein